MQGAGGPELDRALRTLCESSGVGFWRIALDGRTLYLNAAMCELLELDDAAQMGSETYHRYFTPLSLERMRAEHAKRHFGVASTYEVELIGRKGRRRFVVISGVPVTTADGQLDGLIGTFTDLTPLHHAESALRDRDSKLRSLFAASRDAIGISKAGLHVLVNPAYLTMFGYADAQELVGQSILKLIAPGEHRLVSEYVRLRSSQATDLHSYRTRGLRRDGQEFDLDVNVSTYVEADEVYTVVILRDVTEHLQLQEQLRQVQKMDALGRLAGGVAHDFNNLLSVIMGCAELLLPNLPSDGPMYANAALIRSTSERAAGLTRQLLALSRRQFFAPSVIDLNVVVAEMGEMLSRLIGDPITLRVDVDPALLPVRADPTQIQQVLMNLCVNARDAMPAGGDLTISTRNVDLGTGDTRGFLDIEPGQFVRLAVTDTGCGMDETVQSHLFEPFFSTKGPGQGTGLGLSTVYGIVRQSGGYVHVTSSPEAGSTFCVFLPAVTALTKATPAATSARPPARKEAPGAPQRLRSVLLVEDEPTLRHLLRITLAGAGHRVLEAGSAEEALTALAKHGQPVDLVITDIRMPDISGWALCHHLDSVCPGLPILFISGHTDEDMPADIAVRGRTAFLAKPFALKELLTVAERMAATPLSAGAMVRDR